LCDDKHVVEIAQPELPLAIFSRALVVDGGSRGLEDKVVQALQRLVEEDPGLVFAHDAMSRDLLISGLGVMHLEITLERLKRRTGVDVKLGPPRVPYKETIRGRAANVEGKLKKQTGGHGQFAVCYIDLEPLPHGAGFEFEDAIVGGVVPRQFIPSVEKGVRRALEHGVLAGYPVLDVKVRLIDGKHHSVDSSDAAFQAAGYRAFRTAMTQSNPAILEPIMKLEITVPQEAMGDVIGDLNSRHGKVMGTNNAPNGAVITAMLPLAQTLDYEPKLTAMTHGRGSFTLAFDHYDYCSPQTQDKVVKESGYKPLTDED
jgi:elongation factor G